MRNMRELSTSSTLLVFSMRLEAFELASDSRCRNRLFVVALTFHHRFGVDRLAPICDGGSRKPGRCPIRRYVLGTSKRLNDRPPSEYPRRIHRKEFRIHLDRLNLGD